VGGAIRIFDDAVYPLRLESLARADGRPKYTHESPFQLVIDFFQTKGLEVLKQEDQQQKWYQDWIDYQAKHQIYASVLTPEQYSSLGHQFDLQKLTRLLEAFAYFSPAHAYSLHVTFLGLFPILMSSNEQLKADAIRKLEQGGLFGFGVSEKTHGADLLANEFTVQQAGSNGWVANGSKYYIGNSNSACIISILGRKIGAVPTRSTKRAPFVLFAIRPSEAPAFQNNSKIRTLGARSAFVGAFNVDGHPIPDCDVISQGHDAWDTVANTVNFGKFFLGFGAIGMCAHSFAEAIGHLQRRILYGKPANEMPHIRTMVAKAFTRLLAMKLYANRALDYLHATSDTERRYLLFCAVQKAKVSTEGVKVLALLSECIGARGFEAETFFESALRDAPMIPGLEGSTHINYRLTAQFINEYFTASKADVPAPQSLLLLGGIPRENPYWFAGGDRNAKTVKFAHWLRSLTPFRGIPNVRLFMRQVASFRRFLAEETAEPEVTADAALLIAKGKCLSAIVYAQLVAENCQVAKVAPSTISVIFHGMIEDLSSESLVLAPLFPVMSRQRLLLRRIVRVPETSAAEFESVSQLIATRYGD
jgi:acyl-CoA dehydrogenase